MIVEGKHVLYTPSRNVGSNGSIQVSSQLFLRGSTIVLYHLQSKGVQSGNTGTCTVKVRTDKEASTLALNPGFPFPISSCKFGEKSFFFFQSCEAKWKAWVQGCVHTRPVNIGAKY